MNKSISLLLIIIAFCYEANGQNKKYLLGIEGWGSISQTEESTGFYNTLTNTNTRLYAGKFINNNTVLYTFFGFDYFGLKSSGERTDLTVGKGTSNIREYYATPKFGMGLRRYFSFTDKNKVGLLIDAEAYYGIRVRRFKYESSFSGETIKGQNTENSSEIGFAINTGAYYNLNSNWQFIFKLGGLYYSYLWTKDEPQIIGSTVLPSKGRRMGLNFNSESFRLSFVRLI